jgi:hypothetical protein
MTRKAPRDSGRPPGAYLPDSGVPVELSLRLGSAERKLATNGASEFNHGRGLVAPGFEDAPPNKGGRYRAIPDPPAAKGTLRRNTVGKPDGPTLITLAD